MSDNIREPKLQASTMCDFGPFANGPCGNPVVFTQEPTFQPPTISISGDAPQIIIPDIFALIKENLDDEAFESYYRKDYFDLRDNDGSVAIALPKVTLTGSAGVKSVRLIEM